MTELIYEYVYCKDCGVKQYLGADVHLSLAEVGGLKTDKDRAAVSTKYAASLDILLKFLVLHGGHRLNFWTTSFGVQDPGLLQDQWIYDADAGDIVVPTWDYIHPLGESSVEYKQRRERMELERAYEQLWCAFFDLRMRTEPDLRVRDQISQQMQEWMDKHKYTHMGPFAEPVAEQITALPEPPKDPARMQIEQLAASVQIFEEPT